MITTLLSVAAFALLFALFGLLRPKAGCGGKCAGCAGKRCPLSSTEDSHV